MVLGSLMKGKSAKANALSGSMNVKLLNFGGVEPYLQTV